MRIAYFIQTNILCLAFIVMIYLQLHSKKETYSAQRIAFNRLLLFSCSLCLSDMVASLFDGHIFPGASALLEVSNGIYYISLTLCSYSWMIYTNFRLNGLNFANKRQMYLDAIPLGIMTLALITNHFTKFLFVIDENNLYSRSIGVVLHWIISWGYFAAALVKVLRKLRSSPSRVAKEKLYPLLLFLVAPLLTAIGQMLFTGITPVQCGITFSLVLITVNHMSEMISQDNLTGLNNRGALENYLSDRLSKNRQHMFVLMCDVDDFKTINDGLGHIEGDRALRAMADILRRSCGKIGFPLFLCRYGGDEFIICSTDASISGLQHAINVIREEVAVFNSQNKERFVLSLSVGMAEGECGSYDDVEKLIIRADEDMYNDKGERKKEHGKRGAARLIR